jgi:hypothetical protein
MKKAFLIFSLTIFVSAANCQIHPNPGVDTSSLKVQEAITFMENYIKDFKQDRKVDFSQYFTAEACKKYKKPDKVAFSLIGDNPVYIMGQPTLLSAREKGNTVRLKLQFSDSDTTGNINTYFISNHIISFENNDPVFLVNLGINTSSWKKKQIRNITFHYPDYHHFNSQHANKLINRIVQLENNWDLSPERIDYYFTKTRKEIQQIRGFDFNFYMGGNEVPTGLADIKDNLAFTSGLDEGYFHEIVHIYLNKKYPDSPLKEGIAVYLGGSLGHALKWHLEKLNAFISKNQDTDIHNPRSFYYIDETTNPQYTIQGLLCHLAYQKGGIDELKKLMEYNAMEEIYNDFFDVTKGKENEFLRKQIKKYLR